MQQNLFAQCVCPSPKVIDFNEKRLHWASVVRAYDEEKLSKPGCWFFDPIWPKKMGPKKSGPLNVWTSQLYFGLRLGGKTVFSVHNSTLGAP